MDLQDILLHDETIFKDVRVFNSDYLPEEFKLITNGRNGFLIKTCITWWKTIK